MARRSSGSGSQGRPPMAVVDHAHIEQTKQVLEQAKTAAAMSQAISNDLQQVLFAIDKTNDLLTQLSQSGGGGAAFFAGAGAFSLGPNGGRPVMPPNQTQRPRVGPTGYPGGQGYGMGYGPGYQGGGADFGYGGGGFASGGFGGVLGHLQASVARRLHATSGAGSGGAVSYRQNPDGTYTSFGSDGREIETMSADMASRRAAVSEAAGRFGGQSTISGALRSMRAVGEAGGAEGATGLMGMLGSGGSKLATPIGLALAAGEGVYKLGQFIGDQRAANAQYESIYGPGTSGFDQRMHAYGGRFRNWESNLGSIFGLSSGGLSDSDYSKTFQAVSAMGYQGSDRNQMIGFATNNFNSMGMSVDESIQLLNTNAREASTNLDTLSTSLTNVSKMAQQAGQSADAFRQSFIQSYTNAVNAGFGGSSAALATAQTASTIGQGRQFAGLDTSAMYSSSTGQQILAARMGYSSVLDFTLAAQNNPQIVAQAQQKSLNQPFLSVVSQQGRAWIDQAIAKHGGAQNVATNPNAALAVAQEVETAHPGTMNAQAIRGAMVSAGIAGAENLGFNDLAIYYIQWVAKQGRNFTAPVAQQMAADDQQRNNATANVLSAANKVFGGNDLAVSTVNGKAAYDPVIQKMQDSGVTSVQVETAHGTEVVSLAEAAKHYRGQLTSGTALIANGPKAGSTVGSQYGMEQSARYATGSNRKGSANALIDASTMRKLRAMGLSDQDISDISDMTRFFGGGTDAALFGKSGRAAADKMALSFGKSQVQSQSGGAASGSITVSLTPDAAKYLQINTTGNSLVNRAAQSGAPPSLNSNGSSVPH